VKIPVASVNFCEWIHKIFTDVYVAVLIAYLDTVLSNCYSEVCCGWLLL